MHCLSNVLIKILTKKLEALIVCCCQPEDKSLFVGMSDGLLSIKERKKIDGDADRQAHRTKNLKFNPYKYISPNVANSSPVTKTYF